MATEAQKKANRNYASKMGLLNTRVAPLVLAEFKALAKSLGKSQGELIETLLSERKRNGST